MKPDRILAFDKASHRTVDVQGFLHVDDCCISKATVNDYLGAEIPNYAELGLEPGKRYHILRPADELAKAAPTFNMLPLMDTHIEVSAFDLENPEIAKHKVGSTGESAIFESPYLKNSLVIWPAGAIEGVQSKEKTELSCAYRYEIDMTPGTFEGIPYDGKMKNIIGNHVALVVEGRAGPDVVVADSALPDSKASTIIAALSMVKEKIEKGMKPEAPEDAREILDDCTGAIDVAVHHLLDFEEENPTNDENPDGVNQYNGAAHGAKEASASAKSASIRATSGSKGEAHKAAANAHVRAANAHKQAAKLGDKTQGEQHTKEAESHMSKAIGHSRMANKMGVDCSIAKDIAERKDASAKSGKTEYGNVEFADPKNHKYPIDTEEHVRAALSYWGKPKNKNKYSKEDQSTITKRIQSAAKRFKIGEAAGKGGQAHDSKETLMGKHKQNLTPQGHAVRGVLLSYLKPRLAADGAIKPGELENVAKSVRSDKYAKQLDGIVGTVKDLFGKRIAADADLDIEELKDLLENLGEGGEELDEDDLEDAKSIKDDGDEDEGDDSEPGVKLVKKLAGLNIPEADLEEINGLITAMSKPKAEDEDEIEDEKPPKGGLMPAKKKEDGLEPQPVTKPAMDAALIEQRKVIMDSMHALHIAENEARPFIGEIDALKAGSAEAVYKMALDSKNVNVEGVHPSAYRALVAMLPKPGKTAPETVIADAKSIDEFKKNHPLAGMIQKS